ncbi:MAG: NUDIX hydrolase [Deltaproteobacteria bacterium]|nr:NUDIX hydrolase [Deltaproteobacteria bacterium]
MKCEYRQPPHRFCSWCGAKLNQNEPHRQECLQCGFILYHNSSPCMGAVPLGTDGRILLARRGIEPYYGGWNAIGGFLGYGEDPLKGLQREVKEETGADCIVKDFITMEADIYGDGGCALLNTYFTVQLLSDNLTPQDDVSELRWFSITKLPEDIPFTSDRKALAKLKKKLMST